MRLTTTPLRKANLYWPFWSATEPMNIGAIAEMILPRVKLNPVSVPAYRRPKTSLITAGKRLAKVPQ
jgi:hypothetical protein